MKRAARSPNIYGYVPHEKQIKFHTAPQKNRLYIGGNRSGKTTGGVAEDIFWLTGRHPYRPTPPPPVRGRIIGVDFLDGIEKILRPELARWMPLSELKGGSWETAYAKELRTLTLENDSFVEFMSYEQEIEKFAGTSRHFVHFDEEPPKGIFTENKARLIDTGGSWWISMTPVEGMTWIFDEIYMIGKNDPTADIAVIEADMAENPHLNPGEVESFLAGLDDDDKNARGHGKFVQIGGLVFKKFDPAIHVIDTMVPPKEWEWYASLDHGFNNPTCWLWHAVSPDGQVITFAEHYENERTVDYHAQVVHMRNAGFGRVPDYFVGDPAIAQRQAVTGTSIQQEYAAYGVPISLGNNDVISGINRMNQYLRPNSAGQPRWLITRNCINLIREMQRLRWKTWASKKMAHDNNPHEAIHKKNDHSPDSARYFFTFLPDLTPMLPTAPQLQVPPFSYSTPVPVIGQVDPKFEPQTEWNKEYIDEYIGGIW
jgi:phage terminase large subunit-like protein/quinol monooxygenase YgiN